MMTHPVSPVNEVDGQNFEVRLLLAGVPPLYNVVGDLAASVVLWGLPGQVARVCLDVRDTDVPRGKRAVCKHKVVRW